MKMRQDIRKLRAIEKLGEENRFLTIDAPSAVQLRIRVSDLAKPPATQEVVFEAPLPRVVIGENTLTGLLCVQVVFDAGEEVEFNAVWCVKTYAEARQYVKVLPEVSGTPFPQAWGRKYGYSVCVPRAFQMNNVRKGKKMAPFSSKKDRPDE